MDKLTDLRSEFQKAHMSNEEIAPMVWKNENPAGFQRALDDTAAGHIEILNAQRYDQNQPMLSEQDKENIIEGLPENPDRIQAHTGEIAQSLSREAVEWRDSMTDISNNLDLAGQLLLHQDEFESADITGLLTASQTIAEKYDMTLSQAADGLGLNVSDDLMEEITTMEQGEPAGKMEAAPDSEIAPPLAVPDQPQF